MTGSRIAMGTNSTGSLERAASTLHWMQNPDSRYTPRALLIISVCHRMRRLKRPRMGHCHDYSYAEPGLTHADRLLILVWHYLANNSPKPPVEDGARRLANERACRRMVPRVRRSPRAALAPQAPVPAECRAAVTQGMVTQTASLAHICPGRRLAHSSLLRAGRLHL